MMCLGNRTLLQAVVVSQPVTGQPVWEEVWGWVVSGQAVKLSTFTQWVSQDL